MMMESEEGWELDPSAALYYFIPATMFASMGLAGLLTIVLRIHQLGGAASFADKYVPEPNLAQLRLLGYSIIPMCLFCIFVTSPVFHCLAPNKNAIEEYNPCWADPFEPVFYSIYMVVAGSMILESKKSLPPDSHRVVAAFGQFLAFSLWNARADRRQFMADTKLHQMFGLISAMHGGMLLHSVHYPKNMVSYVASYALLLVQGVWFFVAACISAFGVVKPHSVPLILTGVIMALTFGLLAATAMLVAHHGDYQKLDQQREFPDSADDEEEE